MAEAIVRVNLIKNSDIYQKAFSIPRTIKKGKKSIPNPERKQLFKEAWKIYRFSDYELQAFANLTANQSKWIALKIDSNTQQKLGTRAFDTAKKVLLGQAKKVRFKVPSRFRSLEGKTNKQGIRFKNN